MGRSRPQQTEICSEGCHAAKGVKRHYEAAGGGGGGGEMKRNNRTTGVCVCEMKRRSGNSMCYYLTGRWAGQSSVVYCMHPASTGCILQVQVCCQNGLSTEIERCC